jgi:lipoic acid synthetase
MVRSSYRADKVFDKNNLGLAVPEVPEPSNAMQIPVKAIE